MDDNPYRSPKSEPQSTPALRPPVPTWRKALSLPLVVLGICYSFAFPSALIEAIATGFKAEDQFFKLFVFAMVSAAGIAAAWLGFRLRWPKI